MNEKNALLYSELRNLSLKIFKEHSSKDSIDFVEVREENSDNNTWKAMIFVGGDNFRCLFSVDFSTISLLGMASSCFADVAEKDYVNYVKDFVREYCNQVAGKIKAAFEKVGAAYISLPMVTRDYDYKTLFNAPDDKILHDTWSFGEHSASVKVDLYFHTKKEYENFDFISEHLGKKDQEQEIEFF